LWWGIAESQLGSGSTLNELAAYDNKTIADAIHPGEVLKIRPS